jgi:hypothetical protein
MLPISERAHALAASRPEAFATSRIVTTPKAAPIGCVA